MYFDSGENLRRQRLYDDELATNANEVGLAIVVGGGWADCCRRGWSTHRATVRDADCVDC